MIGEVDRTETVPVDGGQTHWINVRQVSQGGFPPRR